MEEKGAFWSDAAGPNTLLNCLRAAAPHTPGKLRTGRDTTPECRCYLGPLPSWLNPSGLNLNLNVYLNLGQWESV